MRKYLSPSSVALFLVLVSAPFQWLTLLSAFGLSLKPVHIALGFAFIVVIFSGNRKAWKDLFFGYSSPLTWAYSVYLLWCVVSIVWTEDLSAALPIIFKTASYFACFLVFTILITRVVRQGSFIRLVGWSSLFSVLFFALYMVFIFNKIGYNLFTEYFNAILAADENKLMFRFYPVIFNYSLASGESGAVYLTSLRNTVMGGILLNMILLSMWRRVLKSAAMKLTALAGIALCVVLILTSVSRSNIIIMGICLLLPFVIRTGFYQSEKWGIEKRGKTMWIMFAAVAFIVIALLVATASKFPIGQLSSAAVNILKTRIKEIANDPRLVMYDNALTEINNRVFLGYGIGKEVRDGVGNLNRVHNLFLVSWLETGIVGAVLSLAWYLSILAYLVRETAAYRSWKSDVALEWAVVLPILPLFRVLVSGSGGFTLIEWLALALFFGIMQGVKGKSSSHVKQVAASA